MRIRKSNLIIYDILDGDKIIFLSKRSKNAKLFPDYFSFFGGRIEINETRRTALLREIMEELNLDLKHFSFLGTYQDHGVVKNIFFSKISKNKVDKLKVYEGQYGKWFSEEMIQNEELITKKDKEIILNFFKLSTDS